MSDIIRIRKNSFFSLASSLIRLIVNFFVFWIIARKYGPEIFGQFTVAQTLATNCIFLADFGFDVLLTTDIAANRLNAVDYFRKYFSLKLLFSIVALVVMWIIALIGNISYEARILILIFSVYMIFSTCTNFLVALYRGFEKLEYETVVSLYANFILLILIVVLIFLKSSIILIAAIFALSRIIGFLAGLYFSYKVLPEVSFKIDLSDLKKIKTKVLVFGFHLLFNNLCFQLDTLLLSMWKGDYETGIYQAVFKLILLTLIIPDILSNAILPTMARFYMKDVLQWKKTGYILNKILLFIALMLGCILFIYADQIISILYGKTQYAGAAQILKLMVGVMILRFMLEPSALMLTTSKRQHIRMIVVIMATVINIGLNYHFIRNYGAYGAAIVALITNFLISISYILANTGLILKWFFNLRMFAIISVAAIVNICIKFWMLDVILGTVFILISFFVVGYFYYFSPDERKKIFSMDFGFNFVKKYSN
jgi:O-antigen/teichoic acid export membrane protein